MLLELVHIYGACQEHDVSVMSHVCMTLPVASTHEPGLLLLLVTCDWNALPVQAVEDSKALQCQRPHDLYDAHRVSNLAVTTWKPRLMPLAANGSCKCNASALL